MNRPREEFPRQLILGCPLQVQPYRAIIYLYKFFSVSATYLMSPILYVISYLLSFLTTVAYIYRYIGHMDGGGLDNGLCLLVGLRHYPW